MSSMTCLNTYHRAILTALIVEKQDFVMKNGLHLISEQDTLILSINEFFSRAQIGHGQ